MLPFEIHYFQHISRPEMHFAATVHEACRMFCNETVGRRIFANGTDFYYNKPGLHSQCRMKSGLPITNFLVKERAQ